MIQAIQLYGYLILTLLAIICPIIVILLSMFREGISKLSIQFENEKAQSEKNIKAQLKKISEASGTNVSEIERGLKDLKKIKKIAVKKLSNLNPLNQIINLFIPLLTSFSLAIVTLIFDFNVTFVLIIIAISIIIFGFSLVILWNLLCTIIDIKKTFDDNKKVLNVKMLELFSILLEKLEKGLQYFLKKVYIDLNNTAIKDNKFIITCTADKKLNLNVALKNGESRMVKNLEIGLIFNSDFIIEKKDYYDISTTETKQVIRYETKIVHGKTKYEFGPLIITPLKVGEFKIKTFIKAENVESMYHDILFKVIKG